ncbi:DUF6454 family protein [Runella salmonicolor]|uniref:DUF6454 family protein n=1 Tax=Runella salmonicolor TaxID=2950278 RepID=A0ABT1FKL5_9BACT|nr:DUF6454 family protein [Runella salmonicolor]MCP1382279.1 DUF6454 family protein [Runella salmonicolor]
MKYFVLTFGLFYNLFAQAQLVEKLTQLRPDSPWKLTSSVRLQFPSFHPQGMVKIGQYFYLSSVEVTRKRQDNDGGAGIGHLFKFDAIGKLIASITLGEGLMYHPGGIDFDGKYIWVPVAEYRADSRAVIYKVDPETMEAIEVMRVDDHLGGIVHDTEANTLNAVSWGSRRFYQWEMPSNTAVSPQQLRVDNPAFYVDYQDCHYIGQRKMLCGGLKKYKTAPDAVAFALGGLEVVDLKDSRPVHQVPLLLWSPTGAPMTNNPFWMESTATGLRGYFVPDDDTASTLFVYETDLK